ncbi:MAG: magnesium-translocating P-type ATPase [Verrucomicrobiales bacterium]|nr:magnesium-translocating P-type ATPase [Verrucomicrobiales bacterium]
MAKDAPSMEIPTDTTSPMAFWALPSAELLKRMRAAPEGLSGTEAARRLAEFGVNRLRPSTQTKSWLLLLAQFRSPIVVILLAASILSFFLGESLDASIILLIVVFSGLLGFWQEKGAADAVQSLLSLVQIKTMVRRDGQQMEIPVEKIVPGEIVVLHAGDLVPADGALLEGKTLFVDEATLTGETLPTEKLPGIVSPEATLGSRTNSLYMGTHVVSGTGTMLVVTTGAKTEFGKISERLKLRPSETEFERGVRRFGYMVLELTLILVIAIFAINVYFGRPVLEAFLFTLALAVGLTPQLLPAIISVNLAQGAKQMAEKKVVVKRLASIENFGSMDILCSDKTGTLTESSVRLEASPGVEAGENPKVLQFAFLNALFQTGYTNPIDQAILARDLSRPDNCRKLDEEPYDFNRRRLSVLLEWNDATVMISKGALPNILNICTQVEMTDGRRVELKDVHAEIDARFKAFCGQGYRILGVCYRPLPGVMAICREHERDMVFLGFLLFSSPLKAGIAETLKDLHQLGIQVKIITGDHHEAARSAAHLAGLKSSRVLTGSDLAAMSDTALLHQASRVNIFAEVEPNQKERIIRALQKAGHVVGFLGDGINDASALHAADVGISVESAADAAKEAADIVLLEKDLAVLGRGVREGRRTFANTLKYVYMATAANFGNMFSMAGASLFLSFLPLLPKQILLTNLLTDFPEMTIATDRVDRELLAKPRRWDIKSIRKFMLTFGLISSIFDFVTFALLMKVFHTSIAEFRTAWFMESVISASLVVLVMRTRISVFKSLPSRALLTATAVIVCIACLLPFSPLSSVLGFTHIPLRIAAALALVVLLYLCTAEFAKRLFFRHNK